MALFGKPNIEKMLKKKDYEGLIETLGYMKDSNVRIEAAEALGKAGDDSIIELLINTLEDGKLANTQIDIIKILGQIGDKRAVNPLINMLRSDRIAVRLEAAEALVKLDHKNVVFEPLVSILGLEAKREDSDWENWELETFRKRVVNILGLLDNKHAVKPLIKVLGDSDSGIRNKAADVLTQLCDNDDVELLIKALDYCLRDNHPTIVRLIGNLCNKEDIPLLIHALGSEKIRIKEGVKITLSQMEKLCTFEVLSNVFEDNDNIDSLCYVVEILGRLRDSRAIEWLTKLLSHTDEGVRLKSVWALGELGSKHAIEPLKDVLKDENKLFRHHVLKALYQLGYKQAEDLIILELIDPDDSVCRMAIETLGEQGVKRAVQPLINLLVHDNQDICRSAGKALEQLGESLWYNFVTLDGESLWKNNMIHTKGKYDKFGDCGDTRIVEPLIRKLEKCDDDIRDQSVRKIVEALGKLGDKQAVVPLINRLCSVNHEVRYSAAISLDQLGESKWRTFITGDNQDFVNLSKTGNVEFINPLINTLEKCATEDIPHVVAALEIFGDRRAIEPLNKVLGRCNINDIVHIVKTIRLLDNESIGYNSDKRLVKALISCINIRAYLFYEEKITAAKILGEIGDSSATKPLLNAIDKIVKDHYYRGSEQIIISNPYSWGEILIERHDEYELLIAYINSIVEIGDKDAIEMLHKINDQSINNALKNRD